jgi:DNA-binding transcriptional MerR regulator
MTAAPAATTPLRIGEVAERVGTTTRTVRYYEEIGLLPGSADRARGQHRLYGEADVERLEQILRLRDLLGVSLDELKQLIEAEDARAELRAQWERAEGEQADPQTRRRILEQALVHIDRQLALVRGRRAELERLEDELCSRRRRLKGRLRGLG